MDDDSRWIGMAAAKEECKKEQQVQRSDKESTTFRKQPTSFTCFAHAPTLLCTIEG